jgi:hypothetical protein
VELHTAAWHRTSSHLHTKTLALQASKQMGPPTFVDTSNNEEDADRNTSAADKISGVCGTESRANVQNSNPGHLEQEHGKVNSSYECVGPYKGEYDNLLFFFCYMYSKIHKLYKHDDLRAYKRPLK